ncbi:MAG: 4Fe-4S binding protein [Candidatus Coatesbacteria bacterium]|nr:MAG: 4Fe-4S binding protein [Candidatus Coatesbacteria bacterium]
MADLVITRDEDTCVGCKECIVVCPQSGEDDPNSVVVAAKEKGDPPEVQNYDNCIQCMRCKDHCRCDAITFDNAHVVEILVRDESLEDVVRRII